MYRIKYTDTGAIERFKARLVAKGFTQVPGIDYEETFIPVIKHTTIRLVLALAMNLNWSMKQLDMNLHGHLNETVYMEHPPGFIYPKLPSHVCKLNKSLYGLKQAPRAWFDCLCRALLNLGFQNSKADTSLFILHFESNIVLLLVYVDDVIIRGNNS